MRLLSYKFDFNLNSKTMHLIQIIDMIHDLCPNLFIFLVVSVLPLLYRLFYNTPLILPCLPDFSLEETLLNPKCLCIYSLIVNMGICATSHL